MVKHGSYIGLNSEVKKKELFKLMNNAFSDKAVGNVRNHYWIYLDFSFFFDLTKTEMYQEKVLQYLMKNCAEFRYIVTDSFMIFIRTKYIFWDIKNNSSCKLKYIVRIFPQSFIKKLCWKEKYAMLTSQN